MRSLRFRAGTRSSYWRAAWLALGVGLAGCLGALSPLGAAIEEGLGLQWLFTLRGPLAVPPGVAVVSVDRQTADRLGPRADDPGWQRCLETARPRQGQGLSRCMHARLIQTLAARGASVIAFDIAFVDPGMPEEDAALAAAIARFGRAVLLQRIGVERILEGEILKETLVGPIEILSEASAGLAPFPLPKVPARVNQFWAFKSGIGDTPTLPAVALQVHALPVLPELLSLAKAAGAEDLPDLSSSGLGAGGADELRRLMRDLRSAIGRDPVLARRLRGAVPSPSDGAGTRDRSKLLRALIDLYAGGQSYHLNFYGPAGTIPTIPADRILGPDAEASTQPLPDLAGTVVFVGAADLSSVDQQDSVHTVYSREDGIELSGVEVAATAFANLLHGQTLRHPDAVTAAALLLGFGALAGGIACILPGLYAVAAGFGLGALHFGAAYHVFSEDGLWLPVVVPLLLQLPAALLLGLVLQYRAARRERENVSRAVRYYLPEPVAESLAREGRPTMRPDVVYGTCLSTDAEHYTTLSEAIGPQALAALMNEYFGRLSEPVRRHGGMISDIHADSMMCVWTARSRDPNPRRQACLAALEIRDAVARFNRQHPGRALPTRIGLHAGWVAMGNLGGGGHYGYGLIGDIANTTSRIEGLNKYLGTTVLTSEPVVAGLDDLLLRELGSFQLEGKTHPLSVLEIVSRIGDATPDERDRCERFAAAFAIFLDGKWSQAADAFATLLSIHPDDGPAEFYLERCRRYARLAPEHDARVIVMGAK